MSGAPCVVVHRSGLGLGRLVSRIDVSLRVPPTSVFDVEVVLYPGSIMREVFDAGPLALTTAVVAPCSRTAVSGTMVSVIWSIGCRTVVNVGSAKKDTPTCRWPLVNQSTRGIRRSVRGVRPLRPRPRAERAVPAYFGPRPPPSGGVRRHGQLRQALSGAVSKVWLSDPSPRRLCWLGVAGDCAGGPPAVSQLAHVDLVRHGVDHFGHRGPPRHAQTPLLGQNINRHTICRGRLQGGTSWAGEISR